MNKNSSTVCPNNEWVFNDNSMNQLLTLKKWLSKSTVVRLFCLIFSLMTPQSDIP